MNAIILLGAPGSGKGTQTSLLCDNSSFYRVSTGDIIRGEIRRGTLLGKSVGVYQAKGELVPDDVVCDMVFSNLDELEDLALIFDGFPRTLYQAQELDKFLERKSYVTSIFLIEVSFDSLLARIASRICCTSCDGVFRADKEGLSAGSLCPKCGSTLAIRKDDKPDVVRNRYEIYCKEISPVKQFYGNRIQTVNGLQDPNVIQAEILNRLNIGISS